MFVSFKWGSKCICYCFWTGKRFRKHCVCPEPRGGAQLGHIGGFCTSASFRPGKNWKPLQQSESARADNHGERLAAVWNWTAGTRTPILHLRWDICLENFWLLTPQTGRCGRSRTRNVFSRWEEDIFTTLHAFDRSSLSYVLKDYCLSELRSCGFYESPHHYTLEGVKISVLFSHETVFGLSSYFALLSFFPAAFYSSKYGYKMCLRLYLNGDGTGRGTHLSLFFVVMRGKCDALLKWPFSQKVGRLVKSFHPFKSTVATINSTKQTPPPRLSFPRWL